MVSDWVCTSPSHGETGGGFFFVTGRLRPIVIQMIPEGTSDLTAQPDDWPPVRIPITGELDLHTFRPREIPSLLDSYLTECAVAGLREVRIVHGKGTGTLLATVHAWLRCSPRVAGFRLGNEHTGSWGATLVTLKPRGDKS